MPVSILWLGLLRQYCVVQAKTYWGLSNSPYIIQRQLTISPDVELSIEAGVNIVFDGAASGLTVSGRNDL